MRLNKVIILVLGFVLIIGSVVNAFELLNENEDPSKVVNTLSLSDSPWRSKTMVHPEKFTVKSDREWSGKDFFLNEFGVPCDFSKPEDIAEIKEFMRFDPKGKHEFRDGAYESENAYFVDRGNLAIANTDIDRVYQTEVYGNHVLYHIPVPKGRYNVYLHFAETFAKNKRPGARSLSFKVEKREHDGKVAPFAMAGGFAKALVVEEKNIPVYDGIIDIELNGNVELNGIEIKRLK